MCKAKTMRKRFTLDLLQTALLQHSPLYCIALGTFCEHQQLGFQEGQLSGDTASITDRPFFLESCPSFPVENRGLHNMI